MKLQLLTVLLACMTCITIQSAHAQQGAGTRYVDSVFASYTLVTDTYSTVYNLAMDIYQPTGDTATHRPLIILAHGGSFTSGTRTDDNVITQLCADFAHKGYVTVSIDYRLIDNAIELVNADTAIQEVLEAVGDGKASVRFFYKDVLTNGNRYKIDTNNIFLGGNSAGAVLFMHYGYITQFSQLNSSFQAIIDYIGGGLEGTSGNAGYSTNYKGIINLAGALNQAGWIDSCDKPIVSAQGTADPIVPYTCGDPEYGTVPVQLCGLGAMAPFITSYSSYYDTMTFPGAGHVPWQTSNTDFYMIDTMITSFLYHCLSLPATSSCEIPYYGTTGVQNIKPAADLEVYPIPAGNVVNIRSSQYITDLTMTDETGRTVASVNGLNTMNYQLNTSQLSAGVYILKTNSGGGYMPAIRKITIE